MVKLVCLECNIEFERKRKDQKCCSPKCSYENLKNTRKKITKEKTKNKFCPNCSMEFIRTGANQKYCSKQCQYEKTLSLKREETRKKIKQSVCLQCGKPINILPAFPRKKWCSHNCSEKAQRNPKLNPNYLIRKEKILERRIKARLENPDKIRKYHREYARKHRTPGSSYTARYRILALQKIANNVFIKCVRCGFSDIRALCIDHINGKGRDDRKDKKTPDKFYKYILSLSNEEINQKYQILCGNCNMIKRVENREHPQPKLV